MSQPNPTPYPELNMVLHELVARAQQNLADNFIGAYLHGSFAVGDADEHSDVDFLIAVDREITDDQRAALQAMHEAIYDLATPWAQHLEGSYCPRDLLTIDDKLATPLLYLDNGSRTLIRSAHDNTMVVRWVLREHGITLAGPPPNTLIDAIDPADLRQEVCAVMRDWGGALLANPDRMNTRWYQPFAVLSYCRMLHTLHTGTIESKLAGATWAKANLDSRWVELIERAWAERPGHWLKVQQPADPAELQQTITFITYALQRIDLD